MSYILNALRKSERERLAQQPDTVTGRILVDQSPPRHKRSKLLILLIITNLIVVVCLFWFILKKPGTPLPEDILKTPALQETQVKPVIVQPVKMAAPTPKPIIKKPEPASPSIAELTASKKTQALPIPATKAVVKREPVPAQLKPDPVNLKMEPKSTAAAQVEPDKMVEKKPEAVAENKSIPFLFELPAEFRHTVPELKINVFVYSQQPAQRFVMIDMVKYNVGDRIKESILLKEIRSDSFVVEYNNRTFRIKRP